MPGEAGRVCSTPGLSRWWSWSGGRRADRARECDDRRRWFRVGFRHVAATWVGPGRRLTRRGLVGPGPGGLLPVFGRWTLLVLVVRAGSTRTRGDRVCVVGCGSR